MQTGRPAIFCRFSGCNLWTGREQDRDKAVCQFCDTDFVGTDGENGGKYTSAELAKKIRSLWPDMHIGEPYVVCTGGEPLLQLDREAIDRMHDQGFTIAVETNGTIEADPNIDWICMSPKANAEIKQTSGHELKFVYPQTELDPKNFEGMDFSYFFLQPMDGPEVEMNTQKAIEYCLQNPKWRLSLQTHKFSGIK
ncbi:UNVERIFIED_CONTAM: hypothetical protein GTU68_063556 [Idotea baltica]|nr:hypothetical protein [Idotea baltica]